MRAWSLQKKILLLSLALSIISILTAIGAYWGLDRVTDEYGHVARVNLPKTQHLNEMYLNYQRTRINLRTLGLAGVTKTQRFHYVESVTDAVANYEKATARYIATKDPNGNIFTQGEEKLFSQVETQWKDFKKVGLDVLEINKSDRPDAEAQMVRIFLTDCPEKAERFDKAFAALSEYHELQARKWVKKATTTESQVNWSSLILSTCGLVFSMAAGWAVARSVSREIESVEKALRQGTDEVARASDEISKSSDQLASSSSQQGAALQETSAAIDESSAMIAKNAENANRSALAAEACQTSASEGQKSVIEMLASIHAIDECNTEVMKQIESSNQEINSFTKMIGEIDEKTRVINDIVFQTKLLSFNASVEAARAGEHGRGFAVVAEEIGNLATMSGRSAKEIADVLIQSTEKVDRLISDNQARADKLLHESRARTHHGMETARRCEHSLQEIVENATSVRAMVSEIAIATQEQSQGMKEIAKAMAQLDQVAQVSQSASESASATSSELKHQVENQGHLIAQLHAVVHGSNERLRAADNRSGDTGTVVPLIRKQARLHRSAAADPFGDSSNF